MKSKKESLIHSSELKETKMNTITNEKELNKMKEKFTFVRNITNLSEVFIALGEGLIIANHFIGNNIDGYELGKTGLKYTASGEDLPNHYYKAVFERFSNKPEKWKAYRKEKLDWFDNIPEQGVLCWVYDNNKEPRYTDIIISYDITGMQPFLIGNGNSGWKNAIPLTQEEVLQYIWSPNND